MKQGRAQNDSAMVRELSAYANEFSAKFWPPNESLNKVRSEMYFALLHIRSSRLQSFEIFSGKDTVLKQSIEQYLGKLVGIKKFTSVKDHDYIMPIVIKNSAPVQGKPFVNTDYDFLLWRSGKPKKFNALNILTSLPVFIFRNSKPMTRPESLSTKGL